MKPKQKGKENWVHEHTHESFKRTAKKVAVETEKKNEGKKQVTIKHPTLPRTVILKYV